MDFMGFWQGRVTVQACGGQIERFINLLHRRRIPLLSPRRQPDGSLIFILPCKSFFRLREPAFKTGTRIRILKKQGFFMIARPFRRRIGLAVGLALFLGLVLYSSCFIWQIRITGCYETSSTQVLEGLKDLGLTKGCSRKIDVGMIENQYLLGNDKLSWMSINIRGTTAFVEVHEKGPHPKVEDQSIPTNIYAARDGVILSIADYSGTRQVEVGMPVMAGDLLVSGDWTDKYGVRRLSHCVATVIAATRRNTAVSVPLQETVRQKTGNKQRFFTISLGKSKFPLYFKQKINYNNYDIVEKEYPFQIGAFVFPLAIGVQSAEEVCLQPVTRTVEEARTTAMTRLGFYETDVLSGIRVVERQLREQVTDAALIVEADYSCEENIGIEIPIKE